MALDPNKSVAGVMPTHENVAERSTQESEEQPLLRSDPIPTTWSPPPGFLLIQIGKFNQIA